MNIFTIIVSKRGWLFALSALLLTLSSYGQNELLTEEEELSTGKMKARAAHAMRTGDIYTSLFYYEEIVKKDSQDLDARFELAEMYRYSRNYTKAEETYAAVFRKAPGRFPMALYYMGLMQKMSGKFEQAKENMILFRKEAGNLGDRDFKALLNKEIAGCDSGIVYREFPDNVNIENAGSSVNYPHTEFSPFLLDSNTMVFGSLRMEGLKFFDKRDDHYEEQPLRQVYKAEKVNGKWEEKGLYEVFNDPDMDMGNFVYSAASGKYYFSKCTKDVKGHVTCRIYSTEKVNGKWTDPVALPAPVNLEGYTSTQPTIMVDTATTPPAPQTAKGRAPVNRTRSSRPPGRASNKPQPKVNNIEYLYFVSDRPGGKGGTDIWYTYYNAARKTWVEPVNFAVVNTAETECTPYFHIPTQTLYFSSSGQATAGGLDVYKINRDGRRFTRPQNLSFPINSPQDELGFMLDASGTKGVLVSNRPGGTPYFHSTCCDDIYEFEIMPARPFVCTLDLTLVDPDTSHCRGQLLKVFSYDLKTKKQTMEKVPVSDCRYKLALDKNHIYKFVAERPGFEKDTLMVETREMASSEVIEKQLVMKRVVKKEQISLINEKPTEGKTFVLKDIQYETNQSALTDAAKAVLDSVLIPFLKAHPQDKVVVSSHTDDQGSHRYNMNLSQQRAENVVKYLVSKGIEAGRLQGKGYGETKPIAPNHNPDGSDNPFGRGINRRTEFLLIKPEAREGQQAH